MDTNSYFHYQGRLKTILAGFVRVALRVAYQPGFADRIVRLPVVMTVDPHVFGAVFPGIASRLPKLPGQHIAGRQRPSVGSSGVEAVPAGLEKRLTIKAWMVPDNMDLGCPG